MAKQSVDPLGAWMASSGTMIAAEVDSRREAICAMVSDQIMARYPMLCYDPTRPDASGFQQTMIRGTPQRIHELIQVVLGLQSLGSLNEEYRWSWGLLPRYGVTSDHLLSFMRIYFDAVRDKLKLSSEDRAGLDLLEQAITQRIAEITAK